MPERRDLVKAKQRSGSEKGRLSAFGRPARSSSHNHPEALPGTDYSTWGLTTPNSFLVLSTWSSSIGSRSLWRARGIEGLLVFREPQLMLKTPVMGSLMSSRQPVPRRMSWLTSSQGRDAEMPWEGDPA